MTPSAAVHGGLPRMAKIAALAALLTAGILLAVGLGTGAAQLVTTETETTTVPTTTTETVETTVQQTTTRRVPVPATTAAGESSNDSIPTWVWVVLGILALAVLGLIIALATRGGGAAAVPPAEARRRLDGAVASWAAQGWALENQTADSAVLRRGGDAMMGSIDPAGQISTRPLGPPPR
jgi:hypothetical protein